MKITKGIMIICEIQDINQQNYQHSEQYQYQRRNYANQQLQSYPTNQNYRHINIINRFKYGIQEQQMSKPQNRHHTLLLLAQQNNNELRRREETLNQFTQETLFRIQ
ncbi:unnamed protein product [Paramecium pentaurelia]|uniref:Uncharacterized protein n=1 Tax=Paramecium pentaurelia TaxID=43138 RepID=A0A8S1TJ97_9CILI|nr:unnamed protein product [Paramecium pentaurelia]